MDGRDDVLLTNLDQPLFDDARATKRDLVEYLEAVSEQPLGALRDRPLSVVRSPRGQKAFMQKNVPEYAPPWSKTVTIWVGRSRREVAYALCNEPARRRPLLTPPRALGQRCCPRRAAAATLFGTTGASGACSGEPEPVRKFERDGGSARSRFIGSGEADSLKSVPDELKRQLPDPVVVDSCGQRLLRRGDRSGQAACSHG